MTLPKKVSLAPVKIWNTVEWSRNGHWLNVTKTAKRFLNVEGNNLTMRSFIRFNKNKYKLLNGMEGQLFKIDFESSDECIILKFGSQGHYQFSVDAWIEMWRIAIQYDIQKL